MAKKKDYMRERLGEKVRQDVATFLRQKQQDSRLEMMSITRVELSHDFSRIKIYWDTYDAHKRGDVKKAMDGLKGALRSFVARQLQLKKAPELSIYYDAQYEGERKVEELLAEESAEGRYKAGQNPETLDGEDSDYSGQEEQ